MKHFYNAKLVEREHKYYCRLGNTHAEFRYTILHSKDLKMSIQMTGYKSGVTYKQDTLWNTKEITTLQPSHLYVQVKMKKELLQNRDFLNFEYYSSTEVKYNFHDIDAFVDFMSHLDETYQSLNAMIMQFFEDWDGLDKLRELRAAQRINMKCLEKIWSPNNIFYRKHAKYFLHS